MTTIKSRKPLAEVQPVLSKSSGSEPEMTVEEYLTQQCDELIKDLYKHCSNLVSQLQQDHAAGAQAISQLMSVTTSGAKPLCVTLKCIGGSHMGQKFRLEPGTGNGEDVFKIGRSTGKLFKEKGVSLYKDKEISTTHAKIEIRNGQAFLVDVRSTNGTLVNSEMIEAQVPYRLKEGDIITMGTTELLVQITDFDDSENVCN